MHYDRISNKDLDNDAFELQFGYIVDPLLAIVVQTAAPAYRNQKYLFGGFADGNYGDGS